MLRPISAPITGAARPEPRQASDGVTRPRRCFIFRSPAALTLALMVLATPASPHAFLARAIPPVGSALPASPAAVTITFTEAIEPLFSTIEVRDERGTRIDRGDPHPTRENRRQLAVSLPNLSPGAYTVIWRATSVDTHETAGSYGFSVTP